MLSGCGAGDAAGQAVPPPRGGAPLRAGPCALRGFAAQEGAQGESRAALSALALMPKAGRANGKENFAAPMPPPFRFFSSLFFFPP